MTRQRAKPRVAGRESQRPASSGSLHGLTPRRADPLGPEGERLLNELIDELSVGVPMGAVQMLDAMCAILDERGEPRWKRRGLSGGAAEANHRQEHPHSQHCTMPPNCAS